MNDIEIVQTNAKRIGFIAGCEWKDEQFAKEKQELIDKACEWWESELIYPTMTRTEIDLILGRIKDFKKAMCKRTLDAYRRASGSLNLLETKKKTL